MEKKGEIPKIIHYFWFGGNTLPEMAKKCIESWKKYCPGYEIKEWNENNYDIESCEYTKEAFQEKKWAFVSDYARFDILYQYGGLYFDTDVELIRPIDEILERGSYMGIEMEKFDKGSNWEITVNPGLGMAAKPGLPLYKTILDGYAKRHFQREDGSLDQETVVTFVTDILKEKGLVCKPGIQEVEGVVLYPKEYFCPMNYFTGELKITEHTYSIHHFGESWVDEKEKYISKLLRNFQQWIPEKVAKMLAIYIGVLRYDGIKAANKHLKKWVFPKSEKK